VENWDALAEAVHIARRENAQIHGLHVVGTKEGLNDPQVLALQGQFRQMCEEGNVQGTLAIEVGEPTQKILERSALADLVVLKIVHPPSTGIRALTSHIRTLITRCPRPILALPCKFSSLDRALLAFDGSPKAKEALFVATYLAEQWQTDLTVFTGLENEQLNASVQEFAQDYLEFNEIQARFITQKYSPENLKLTAEEIDADLIIMGGYSGSILKEMTIGSSVNFMLRESGFPILICR
jgi:nucleotide-binding universal stress UspA family protein